MTSTRIPSPARAGRPAHRARRALASLGLLALTTALAALSPAPADDPLPPLPDKWPVGGVEVLHARPFTLAQPAVHAWRAEQPKYSAGMVLVLAVDKALATPRQTAEPILYVGDQTAARLNAGSESGRLVVVVPAPLGADGKVALDLTAAPIFFGTPGLPEQVDAAAAKRELQAAKRAGIAPPTAAAVKAALQDQVAFDGELQLRLYASDLIEQFSPQEADLVSGLRAKPVTR